MSMVHFLEKIHEKSLPQCLEQATYSMPLLLHLH